ncbi:MAG: transposase [Acidobacteriota bacterium]
MAESTIAIKTFEFKTRPNKHFIARCERTLEACRGIYNAALQERIDCYKITGRGLNFAEQNRHLTEARREVEGVSDTYRDIQTDALDRLDKAYANFFRRVTQGAENPGFPRFKSRDRYDSFGCARRERDPFPIKGDKLKFPGVGSCRVRLSPYACQMGRCRYIRMIRRPDGWYVQLVCETARPDPLPATSESAGLDAGLESFAVLSTGEEIERRRFVKEAEDKLAKKQRRMAKKKRGSNRRKKAKRKVALAHLKTKRVRKRFHFDVANYLVRRFDTIVIENLNIKGLAGCMLAKSVHDVAWGAFFAILICKAAEAGRQVESVNPRGTSQECARCGHRPEERKTLACRWHNCEACGLSISRDHNAALNILSRVERTRINAQGQLRSWLNWERGVSINPCSFNCTEFP